MYTYTCMHTFMYHELEHAHVRVSVTVYAPFCTTLSVCYSRTLSYLYVCTLLYVYVRVSIYIHTHMNSRVFAFKSRCLSMVVTYMVS
jgi:hypothetical protein